MFKESWHKADLEPGAIQRYQDSLDLIKKMEKALNNRGPLRFIIPFAFLDLNPKAHRRIVPDMRQAFSMMALFFPSTTAMYEAEFESKLESHPIVNQAERARHCPDRKNPESNNNFPKDLWKELDSIRRRDLHDNFPEEWDRTIRPIIARCTFTSPNSSRIF